MFDKKKMYSRKEISSLIGGTQQGYIGTKNKIVIGVYLNKRSNPDAPNEILCGSGRDVEKFGLLLSKQKEVVPVFIKIKSKQWEYMGIFQVVGSDSNVDTLQKKAKEANRENTLSRVIYLEEVSFQKSFNKQVEFSQGLSQQERAKYISSVNKPPLKKSVTTDTFIRNPAVVAETLFRANGVCSECSQPAPFKRRSDNTPYLEVHHIKPLSDYGGDTLENTIALCPNCHRRIHFG